jgi:hypothetical protein
MATKPRIAIRFYVCDEEYTKIVNENVRVWVLDPSGMPCKAYQSFPKANN